MFLVSAIGQFRYLRSDDASVSVGGGTTIDALVYMAIAFFLMAFVLMQVWKPEAAVDLEFGAHDSQKVSRGMSFLAIHFLLLFVVPVVYHWARLYCLSFGNLIEMWVDGRAVERTTNISSATGNAAGSEFQDEQ